MPQAPALDLHRDYGDENVEVSVPQAPSMDEFVPVATSMAVLNVITDAQRARMLTLISGYRAQSASLYRDDYANGNLTFALKDAKGDHILSGLIEPDGRAHT